MSSVQQMGIIISQYKDSCKPISIRKCHKGFEGCSDVFGEGKTRGILGLPVDERYGIKLLQHMT